MNAPERDPVDGESVISLGKSSNLFIVDTQRTPLIRDVAQEGARREAKTHLDQSQMLKIIGKNMSEFWPSP